MPGFLNLFLSVKCVCTTQSLNPLGKSFHFLYMTLAIDIIDGSGLSNEGCNLYSTWFFMVKHQLIAIY